MRRLIICLWLGVILAVLGYQTYGKERIKRSPDQVLLDLQPADPRSLLQGDYMRLRYAMDENIWKEYDTLHGKLILQVYEGEFGEFTGIYQGQELAENEKLIPFYRSSIYSAPVIQPNSFFFQEGHAEYYEDASYAVFAFGGQEDYVLVGLADAEGQLIKPDP